MYAMAAAGATQTRVAVRAVATPVSCMRVTTFSDYAMRVLMYLGLHDDRQATIDEIAAAYGISAHHLSKVVHTLGRAGWLKTIRGKGGGLRLAMPPEEIRVGDVVHLCEGDSPYVECKVNDLKNCRIAPACRLSGILGGAFKLFYDELNRYTLADLVEDPQTLEDLLVAN